MMEGLWGEGGLARLRRGVVQKRWGTQSWALNLQVYYYF